MLYEIYIDHEEVTALQTEEKAFESEQESIIMSASTN